MLGVVRLHFRSFLANYRKPCELTTQDHIVTGASGLPGFLKGKLLSFMIVSNDYMNT
jgi:hypothetical protein